MAAHDAWIRWSSEQRKRNLQFIVSNSRFLIPHFVTVRSLASKIQSLAAHRLPEDCELLSGYRPPAVREALLERGYDRNGRLYAPYCHLPTRPTAFDAAAQRLSFSYFKQCVKFNLLSGQKSPDCFQRSFFLFRIDQDCALMFKNLGRFLYRRKKRPVSNSFFSPHQQGFFQIPYFVCPHRILNDM
jgi:hypothetical protein